jgi:hemolysin III
MTESKSMPRGVVRALLHPGATMKKTYTLREEIASSATHGLGVLLSTVGLVALVVMAMREGDPWKVVSFSIFGTSMILLYFASTMYHLIQHEQLKEVFRKFDHAAIYLLIAGTYTPFLLLNLRGPWGWALFGIIWALAVFGVIYKFLLIHKFHNLSVFIYIAMGWLGIIGFKPVIDAVGWDGVGLLFAGGMAYTLGVVFYMWERLPHNHAVWHLFVMSGTALHYAAVYFYATHVG